MKAILILAIAVLAGCASKPTTTARPYCYTSQEIRTKDKETVSSETLVKCNDDPIESITIKRAGISNNCGEFKYMENRGGKLIERRAISCQKLDGTWELVPSVFH